LEELLPNIIRGIRSRRIRCLGHVACMERKKYMQGFGWKNLKERERLKVIGICWRIILKLA
jgi:hypothetical protein